MKNIRIIICSLIALSLPVSVWAAKTKDVYDTHVKLTCSSTSPNSVDKRIKPKDSEKISIDVKKINWNKDDPSKPPLWGSSSQITVTKNDDESSASLIKSTKDKIAFVYSTDTGSSPKLYVYELNLDNLKYKRTEMSIFTSGSNSVVSSEGKCSKF